MKWCFEVMAGVGGDDLDRLLEEGGSELDARASAEEPEPVQKAERHKDQRAILGCAVTAEGAACRLDLRVKEEARANHDGALQDEPAQEGGGGGGGRS